MRQTRELEDIARAMCVADGQAPDAMVPALAGVANANEGANVAQWRNYMRLARMLTAGIEVMAGPRPVIPPTDFN